MTDQNSQSRKTRNSELIQLSLLLALVALFYLFVIPAGIVDPEGMGLDQGLPPSFSARAVAWVTAALLLGRVAQLTLRSPKDPGQTGSADSATDQNLAHHDEDDGDGVTISPRVMAGVASALIFAFVLIPLFGFAPASIVLLIALLIILGERHVGRLLGLPVIVTAGVWLLFEKALSVSLPTGSLFSAITGS